jgi:putative ABC transport system permease protein
VRWRDILGLALSALWQQKVRTLLTLLGVLFGVFVLAASLAIGQGVQDAIRRYAAQNEILRRVEVTTRWDDDSSEPTTQISVPGEMSDARRDRLRRALAKHRALTRGRQERVTLSEDVLKKLAALPHVEAVVPLPLMRGFAVLGGDGAGSGGADSHPVLLNAARPRDADAMKRLVAGRFFERADEPSVVVSEFLLYQLGLRDESAAQAALGRKLRLEFRTPFGEAGFAVFVVRPQGGQQTREEAAALDKVRRQLPDALDKFDLEPADVSVLLRAVATTAPARQSEFLAREFTIAGVMRAQTEEETQAPWDPFRIDADVALPYDTATALFFDSPGGREEGVWRAVVIADRDENVKAVLDDVRKLGLRGHAAVEFIERQRLTFLLIFGGMTCVAAVAMIVAALGITNTMLISVLERTREIGIMKAVGARSGHLQTIFLVEGALIGAAGGALGLLLAWAASFPGDAWVRRIASQKLGTVISDSIFVFPAWLQVAVVGAATLVTVLAAVYPARRAARLDPVTALRHE